jgi:iron-sulfur cluster repair protein YtfE (RIC family)
MKPDSSCQVPAGIITAEMTVNQVAKLRPEALAVLQRLGIDACCGGALPLAEVARKHRLDITGVLAELERA